MNLLKGAVLALLVFVDSRALPETKQVEFKESTGLTVNPGKGWVIYGPDVSSYSSGEWKELCSTDPYADISDDMWEIGSIVYMRFHWSDIEPEEGRFDWDLIDVPLRLAQEKRKQFAFGVMSCNSCIARQATPQYVFDAGAETVHVRGWDNIHRKHVTLNTPTFNDPVYLEKMADFLKALGERYDGNPAIAFFDIRSYGNWGENHVRSLGDMISKITSDEFKNVHVKMHQDAFKKTKLITAVSHKNRSFSTEDDAKTWAWCVDHGVGLRWDGYLYHKTDMVKWSEIALQASAGRDYGILECYQPYGNHPNYTNEAAWKEAIVQTGSSYCSLANWGANGALFYGEHRDFVDRLTNLLGYHFVASSASCSPLAMTEEKETVCLEVENKGVAPILIDASVQAALLDGQGQVVERQLLENVNPRDWKPGEKVTVSIPLEFQEHSDADQLAVGLFSGHAGDQPDIRFGNMEVDDAGWLLISR